METYTVVIARLDNNLKLIEEHKYEVQVSEKRFAPSAATIMLRREYPDTKWHQVLRVINAISSDEQVGASTDSEGQSSQSYREVQPSARRVLGGTKREATGPSKRGRKPKG